MVGGGGGIGLETARQVRAAHGDLVLVARNAERLKRAADELDPLSTAAFDAQDTDRLGRFLGELPGQVDHVVVTAGSPSYTPLAEPFIGGTGGRRPATGMAVTGALLGDQLEAHREDLRKTLPIGRVVEPADVAALALHIMANGAPTGATYDIDGGRQLVAH
ncbi:SDR family NAD(P)-dependent oxidoreductase [Streptomyces sp. NPDC059679]|uniref:SDR family NAD(P)-dependent oxidoreductase n=1 Tax=Streptomyces sp. NPDC059679 TaxID=3346903 RepID=UPI0036CD5401